MSNTIGMLDKARSLCVPATDYQLAKRLGISPSTIARCRNRGGTLDNKAVFKLAKFLHKPFDEVLALVEIDRAKRPADRQFWEHVAPRLLPTLLLSLLLTSAGALKGYVAQGRTVTQVVDRAIHYAHYVLTIIRGYLARRDSFFTRSTTSAISLANLSTNTAF